MQVRGQYFVTYILCLQLIKKMKVVLEISENKASFFMELVKSLSFVEVVREEPAERVVDSVRRALKEVERIERGEAEVRDARDFLNSLNGW